MKISNIKKLPFPDFLLKTELIIKLHDDQSNIDENGSPIVKKEIADQKCIFSEKAQRIIDSDGKELILSGEVILKGDIAPDMKIISSGVVIINNREYQIYSGSRPRNPDGTIHHTTLLLQ